MKKLTLLTALSLALAVPAFAAETHSDSQGQKEIAGFMDNQEMSHQRGAKKGGGVPDAVQIACGAYQCVIMRPGKRPVYFPTSPFN